MTFLELCQAYRAELGIPGNGPVTVVNQIGELARVVLDIQDADQAIKQQWQDWKFLWDTHTTKTIGGVAWLESLKPAELGTWDTNACWLDKTTNNPIQLEYIDYAEWRNDQATGEPFTADPYQFTVLPNGEIRLFPQANGVFDFTGEYWKRSTRLSSNGEVSIVPEEFHRIIIVRAKMIYAEREDAPEIMAGSAAEYHNLITNLEARYLDGQGDGRQARVVRPRVMVAE